MTQHAVSIGRAVDVVDRETGEVLTEHALPARIAPIPLAELVERLASDDALALQQQLAAAYDRACRALIGPHDVHRASDGREYKRKSAWRKLARWAGISTEIIRAERWWEDDPDGTRHYAARVVVRATAPWGQTAEAVGLCDTREARFRSAGARAKATHDVEATAATRATNRAISDLIAAGEVSAEEIEPDGAPAQTPAPRTRPRTARAEQPRQEDGPASSREAPASDAQVRLLRRLLAERNIDDATRESVSAALESGALRKAEAHRLISEFMARPRVDDAGPAGDDAEIPF
ncbi:MAG TPA: hypothetical protein VIL25_09375 [Vicinamibacterales bacterium]